MFYQIIHRINTNNYINHVCQKNNSYTETLTRNVPKCHNIYFLHLVLQLQQNTINIIKS